MSVGRRLCSEVSRENGEVPTGTATPYDAYLVIEVPPPWKDDIARSANYPPGLWEALLGAFRSGVIDRSTGIMPDPEYSVRGKTRVLMLRRPEEPSDRFARFNRSEYLLPDEDLTHFVESLANGDSGRFDAHLQPTGHVRDVLVCTHGANDACCGKFGYPVYERLRGMARDTKGLRVWRSSHLGGHRFAATMLDLPESRCWGHLDPDTAERVLRRDAPAADLAPNYRGWSGLWTGPEQAAERAMLAREGWRWTGYEKRVTSVKATGTSGESILVRIEYVSPDGDVSGTYEAEVEPAPSVMTLTKTGSEPLKEVPQYRVTRLTES